MRDIYFWGDTSYIELFIRPINKHLKNNNYILLIDNCFSKNEVEKYEKDFKIIDINLLSVNEIEKIILKSTSSTIVISNYKSISNIFFIKLAKALNLRLVFLQHGVFDSEIKFVFPNSLYTAIVKNIRLLKKYFQLSKYEKYSHSSLIKTLINIYIFRKLINEYNVIDYAIVYAEHDYDFISKNFGLQDHKILKSSYPIFNKVSDQHEFYRNSKAGSKYILLIHQPLVQLSKSYSYVDEINYYNEIGQICKKMDKTLIIKLHPQGDKNNFTKYSNSSELNIDIENNITLFQKSGIIFGFNSTALFYGILLKKPIILLPFISKDFEPKIDYLGFSEVGIIVENLFELESVITNNEILYSKVVHYEKFIEKYIGRNNSYEYLSNILSNILRG